MLDKLLENLARFIASEGADFVPTALNLPLFSRSLFPKASSAPPPEGEAPRARYAKPTRPQEANMGAPIRKKKSPQERDEAPSYVGSWPELGEADAPPLQEPGEAPKPTRPPKTQSRGPAAPPQILVGSPLSFAHKSMPELDSALRGKDETFTQMLCRKIREEGMSNAECYKKAGLDRRAFSKIISNIRYKPRKKTAIAFVLALELPWEEAEEMLLKAGYAFSKSLEFDLIIQYFIKNKTYDIFVINEALWQYDQPLLGQ